MPFAFPSESVFAFAGILTQKERRMIRKHCGTVKVALVGELHRAANGAL
jgi:hypothetical protein